MKGTQHSRYTSASFRNNQRCSAALLERSKAEGWMEAPSLNQRVEAISCMEFCPVARFSVCKSLHVRLRTHFVSATHKSKLRIKECPFKPIGNMSGTSISNRRWLLGLEANFGLGKTDWTDLNKPQPHWPNFNQCAASRRLQEWGSADIFATYGVRPVEPYLYLAAILLPLGLTVTSMYILSNTCNEETQSATVQPSFTYHCSNS